MDAFGAIAGCAGADRAHADFTIEFRTIESCAIVASKTANARLARCCVRAAT
ncbi:hypothetical protein AZ78_1072 [Lysobacter capsici AZ78]|uniref:Uncharacterized protein n=1 Tax=Lysobacter capsici AZ78 TaxID=1444315 RepID=A0A108U6M9_9GAMM|nr:hypothetical protein AZ78_1072 [Lysobacter capsici AZ78]